MYCSTCGSPHPEQAPGCPECRKRARHPDLVGERPTGAHPPMATAAAGEAARVATCQRCGYRGQGLPYFTRGSHTAGLIVATLFTIPFALGAGGLLYYGLRRDHLICPRCGFHWGKNGGHGVWFPQRAQLPAERVQALNPAGESVRRAWAVMLFVLGAILLTVGGIQGGLLPLSAGLLSVAGGIVVNRGARLARVARREAVIAWLQTEVVRLAGERGGRLTVTETAASLGWTMARAQKILTSLDDGWRVDSFITEEGVIVYEFRELLTRAPSAQPLDS